MMRCCVVVVNNKKNIYNNNNNWHSIYIVVKLLDDFDYYSLTSITLFIIVI